MFDTQCVKCYIIAIRLTCAWIHQQKKKTVSKLCQHRDKSKEKRQSSVNQISILPFRKRMFSSMERKRERERKDSSAWNWNQAKSTWKQNKKNYANQLELAFDVLWIIFFSLVVVIWAMEVGTKGFQLEYTEIRERTNKTKKK